MIHFSVDFSNALSYIGDDDFKQLENWVKEYNKKLYDGTGVGFDFTGWLTLPSDIDMDVIENIKAIAEEIRDKAEVLVCIGIGGSYLGARAVIEAIGPSGPEILFVGKNLSGRELEKMLDYVKDKDFYINVISKSGTTLEPAIAFRFFRALAMERFGDLYRDRIIATTDVRKGILRRIADKERFRCLIIPDNVGGRFSVLTPVGLLPIAVSGIDIDELIKGARNAQHAFLNEDIMENPTHLYAVIRYWHYRHDRFIEILSTFEPSLYYLVEWWKQLFGESEGKDGKGIYPSGCVFTTDLHSLGQYIQDGERRIMETFLVVEKTANIKVVKAKDNLDGLDYLNGKSLDEINMKAYEGTKLAHQDGGVPTMSIVLPSITPEIIGELIYFFEKSVAIGGYLLGVNPFNQPGVEAYKRNMFKLLGRQ